MSSNARPVFTNDQVTKYFDRLRVRDQDRVWTTEGKSADGLLEYLALLVKLHVTAVPFENLTLHYSHHRQICIHPEELFKKIIEDDNGRGGYCMENNCLFGVLLYTLGFNIYPTGARVWDGGQWTGWSHMVNIVIIGGDRYQVDVGFGGNGPIQPLKLDKSGLEYSNIEPATARLQWRNINANTNPDQRLWVYEHKINQNAEFEQTYCFTELEFLPQDYELMSYFTSTNPKTWFTQKVVCEKKVLGGKDGLELVGSVVLGTDVKWRTHGVKEREEQFANEDDRTRALEEVFGIKFSPVEKASIKGLPAELKSE